MHQLLNGSCVALCSSRSATERCSCPQSNSNLWPMTFCLHQLFAEVRLLHRTRTCCIINLFCLILQSSYFDTFHGAQQLAICLPVQDFSRSTSRRSVAPPTPSLFSMHEYSSSKTLCCIVSSPFGQTSGNWLITTSHMCIAVIRCSR